MIQAQGVSYNLYFQITSQYRLIADPFTLGLLAIQIFKVLQECPEIKALMSKFHFSAFYLRHIQHVVNESEKMLGRHDYFLKTILYLIGIIYVLHSDSTHTYNSVHRRTDLMTHPGKKLALRQVSRLSPFQVALYHGRFHPGPYSQQ